MRQSNCGKGRRDKKISSLTSTDIHYDSDYVSISSLLKSSLIEVAVVHTTARHVPKLDFVPGCAHRLFRIINIFHKN